MMPQPQPEVSVSETEVIEEDTKRRLREVVDAVSNYPPFKKQRIETISKVIVDCVDADRSVIFVDDKHSIPFDTFIVGLADRRKPDTQELIKRACQALLRRENRIVEPSPEEKRIRRETRQLHHEFDKWMRDTFEEHWRTLVDAVADDD